MDLGLQGKAALVTGASKGIGAAIARALAREGCDVAIAARSEEGLERTAQGIRDAGRRALIHEADLRERAAPEALVQAAVGAFGRLDIVVCNAGATRRAEFQALTEEDWADGFALKFTAHRRLAKAAWPHLASARGSLLFVAGVGGRTPGAAFALGGAVNAALLSLTKALADLGLKDGVRVNAVNPGGIETDRLRDRVQTLAGVLGVPEDEARARMVTDLGTLRLGDPEDVASLVAFVSSARGSYLHGAILDVDGGQTKTF